MPIIKTDRESIIKESVALFKIHGYYNTTMANIGEACGLIKGSMYHYFKSKEQIGLESLKYVHEYFNQYIFSIAYQTNLSDREKMTQFVKKNDEYFLKSAGGCLLGNLALEAAHDLPEFKEEIIAYFTNWEHALIEILKNNFDSHLSKEIASEAVASWQGAIMMMNLYDNPDSYLRVGKKLIAKFN